MQAIMETIFDFIYLPTVYILAGLRIALCFMPQNAWTSPDAPLSWAVYRNIPFTILGLLIIGLFYKSAKEKHDKAFGLLWLTIVLSFGFYIPVVLFSDAFPLVGILMIPKTCAYVWTLVIGFSAMRKTIRGRPPERFYDRTAVDLRYFYKIR